mmetsp:Transcript_19828/g.43363  ORF Transcript_19828/g.43363 Transcript_19828/m.43363 type:complete len:229 (+) Transcript_19828:989-1675(+)
MLELHYAATSGASGCFGQHLRVDNVADLPEVIFERLPGCLPSQIHDIATASHGCDFAVRRSPTGSTNDPAGTLRDLRLLLLSVEVHVMLLRLLLGLGAITRNVASILLQIAILAVLANKERATVQLDVVQCVDRLCSLLRSLELDDPATTRPSAASALTHHVSVDDSSALLKMILQILPGRLPGEVADVHTAADTDGVVGTRRRRAPLLATAGTTAAPTDSIVAHQII